MGRAGYLRLDITANLPSGVVGYPRPLMEARTTSAFRGRRGGHVVPWNAGTDVAASQVVLGLQTCEPPVNTAGAASHHRADQGGTRTTSSGQVEMMGTCALDEACARSPERITPRQSDRCSSGAKAKVRVGPVAYRSPPTPRARPLPRAQAATLARPDHPQGERSEDSRSSRKSRPDSSSPGCAAQGQGLQDRAVQTLAAVDIDEDSCPWAPARWRHWRGLLARK